MVDIVVGNEITDETKLNRHNRFKTPAWGSITSISQVITAAVLIILVFLIAGWQKTADFNSSLMKSQNQMIKNLESEVGTLKTKNLEVNQKEQALNALASAIAKGETGRDAAFYSAITAGNAELVGDFARLNALDGSLKIFTSMALYGDQQEQKIAHKNLSIILGVKYYNSILKIDNQGLKDQQQKNFTGFFMNNRGYILTTKQCLSPVDDDIKVTIPYDDKFITTKATAVKVNEALGIAFLKIENASATTSLQLMPKPAVGDEDIAFKGEPVFIIATRDSESGPRTIPIQGKVDMLTVENEPDYFLVNIDFNTMFTADINGAPVLNQKGMVVGVVETKSINSENRANLKCVRSDRILEFLKQWKTIN